MYWIFLDCKMDKSYIFFKGLPVYCSIEESEQVSELLTYNHL